MSSPTNPPKSRFPDALVLIFAMIIVAQIATYFLPTGEFQREGRTVLAGTYAEVEAAPLPWHSFLTLISKGLQDAADIIFFVFIVGGVIAVIRATGAIDALIGSAIQKSEKKPLLLIGGIMTLLAVGSSTIGMAEEYMPFIPILVTMCLALKYDAIVAIGIIYVAAGVGYGCAALNPFTVMIAQEIAGLDQASSQSFRWALLGICLTIGIHHVMRYAKRVQQEPAKSLVKDVDYSQGYEMPEDIRLTPQRVIVLLSVVLGFGVFVYGVKYHDWYFTELAAIFFGLAILSAVVCGLSPNRTSQEFCKGAAQLTTTALLIGFARTIEVLLKEAKVIDTVINGIAGPLGELGSSGAAVGMLAVQSACNFFIPSGSGQAYVTMPILAPMSDLVGVTRQTSVLAYQFGDGFMNMIVPTNALLMGMLGLGRVPYQRWVRFALPLLVKLFVVAVIALIVAVRIDLQ